MLLDFLELVGLNDRKRILLAVDHLLFERGVNLGKRHRNRVGAQCIEGVDVNRRLNHAQLEAGDILGGFDRAPAVRHVAEAQIEVGQVDQAFFRQLGVESLADLTVENLVNFLGIVEQEGEVDDGKFLDLPLQDAGVHRGEIERTALNGGQQLRVAAENATGENLDFHLAAALLCDQGRKLVAPHRDRVSGRVCGCPAQIHFTNFSLHPTDHDQAARSQDCHSNCFLEFHFFLLLKKTLKHQADYSALIENQGSPGPKTQYPPNHLAGTMTNAGKRIISSRTTRCDNRKGDTPRTT